MTSVCSVSCSMGCCRCVCCSFCGLIWFLLAVFRINGDEVVVKFVKHFKSSFFTAFLECGPGKLTQDVWW